MAAWEDALRVKVKDLDPLHSPDVSGDRPRLRCLTDAELLDACQRPHNGDRIKIGSNSGKVVDGNGRVYN